MSDALTGGAPFPGVERTVRGHFQLHFYAAVYRLVNHLRRLAEAAGEDLEPALARHPFLARYGEAMQRFLPRTLTWDGALAWWPSAIAAWEADVERPLPLVALGADGGVSFRQRIALFVAGLAEEDSRFGAVFAELQEPLAARRPCVELVGQIMADAGAGPEADGWELCRSLIAAGLLESTGHERPRTEWELRVPGVVWDAIRSGEITGASWCEHRRPDTVPPLEDLILPEELRARLARVPALLAGGNAGALVVRGTPGSDRTLVLAAVARALGRGVIESPRIGAERWWPLLGPLCALTRSMPVLVCDLGPGETAEPPALAGYRGPVGIALGLDGGLTGAAASAVTLTLPAPRRLERMRHWEAAFAGHAVVELDAIVGRFSLPAGHIRRAAAGAVLHARLAGRDAVALDDVREACRELNRQLLDALASRLDPDGAWEQLVVSDATAAKLLELERRCRHREALLDHVGAPIRAAANRGVRALFTGASGTGKTMAAKILAGQLGMDVYRVDLAAVVNKYVGETEKNLHRVLASAEELDVILLLDEGDSLLGTRTEVHSANDRYANLETNYLLQRLETYQGIVVVTTNSPENVDSAFQRRMDVVVSFVPPQPAERWRIWQLHLPAHHGVEPAQLERIAVRCALTGGQIRNAALHAALLALDDGGGAVTRVNLEEAIHSEYRKIGATSPLAHHRRPGSAGGGADAFVRGLAVLGGGLCPPSEPPPTPSLPQEPACAGEAGARTPDATARDWFTRSKPALDPSGRAPGGG